MKYLFFPLLGILLCGCFGVKAFYKRITLDKTSWKFGQIIYPHRDIDRLQYFLETYYGNESSWPTLNKIDSLKASNKNVKIVLKDFKSIEIDQHGDTAKIKFLLEYKEPELGFKLLKGKLDLLITMDQDTSIQSFLSYSKIILNNNLEPQLTNGKYVTANRREFKKWTRRFY